MRVGLSGIGPQPSPASHLPSPRSRRPLPGCRKGCGCRCRRVIERESAPSLSPAALGTGPQVRSIPVNSSVTNCEVPRQIERTQDLVCLHTILWLSCKELVKVSDRTHGHEKPWHSPGHVRTLMSRSTALLDVPGIAPQAHARGTVPFAPCARRYPAPQRRAAESRLSDTATARPCLAIQSGRGPLHGGPQGRRRCFDGRAGDRLFSETLSSAGGRDGRGHHHRRYERSTSTTMPDRLFGARS